ncbi:response regulator [Amylibacter sp. SFDW26]|uniref:ATP-binding protein n=1 Tax=Amylibacter sp. SFDW26 TaxID=2652722 RepID=UPI0012615C9F|nr:ATP-binding protein [Amylibacter sp. SFDW26]KAB7613785.1 response regulator [Amylibacter sp. SFDW26]
MLHTPTDSPHVSRRRYNRERLARQEAEQLLDGKSRELWDVNQKLIKQADDLEQTVQERTADLEKAREVAEAASHAKSVFLASMSHEIRTPLNGVLGMAEALTDTKLSDEQKSMAATIVDSGQLLLAVLNDILDLSKIEAGQLEIETLPFDLEALFIATHQLYSFKAIEKGITFEIRVEESAKRWIKSDPVRLRQVVGNLISNAIKFTSIGSVIVDVTLDTETNQKGKLNIAVYDTGLGIPANKIAGLCQPFVQVDASVARKHGGTGLGLSISKQICALMDGDIHIESTEGSGSCFTATVNVILTEAIADDAERDMDSSIAIIGQKKWRILLAEDNRTNQLVFKKFIKQFDLDITVAGNGQEAIDATETTEFDLIFMDINMPIVDGVMATQAIRKKDAELNRKHTPILALTANTMVHQIAEYIDVGMDNHLAKPVKKNVLFQVMADALSGVD